jgi:hypothetical protein
LLKVSFFRKDLFQHKICEKIVTEMSVDRSVSRSPGETLAFSVLNVLSLRTHELLGESEVDNKDPVGVSAGTYGSVHSTK